MPVPQEVRLAYHATVLDETGHDAELIAHVADTTDAHDAAAISFSPTGTIAATDVQAAIAEVASEAANPDASDVVFAPAGTTGSSDVQAALEEIAAKAWMPLTTVVSGVPDLVWDGDDELIPTLATV